MSMPSQQAAFLTKHLDIWVNADVAWLPAGAWDKCGDPSLDLGDFLHEPCYVGIDLALRSDIAAVVLALPPTGSRDWWAVFGRYYLPEATIAKSENAHFQGWETAGRLTATPGVITDFDYILDTLADMHEQFDVVEMVYDPYDAGPLVVGIEKRGLKRPVELRQTAPNMGPAMVELEGLVLGQRIRHDGDPMLAWMISNVRCHRTTAEMMRPTKDNDAAKIDGACALLMAINRGMRYDGGGGGDIVWAV